MTNLLNFFNTAKLFKLDVYLFFGFAMFEFGQ